MLFQNPIQFIKTYGHYLLEEMVEEIIRESNSKNQNIEEEIRYHWGRIKELMEDQYKHEREPVEKLKLSSFQKKKR